MTVQFQIRPDWRPIETAPKDRPIWLLSKRVDFNTGKPLYQIGEYYWGVMLAYPDHEPGWLPVGHGDNACLSNDAPFTREVFRSGQPDVNYLYRGFQTTHWADIIRHSISTVTPPEYYHWEFGKPYFEDIIRS